MMLLIAATTMNAQTIVKGDMNDDGKLTITDVVSIVDVILGKAPQQTIDPYMINNSLIVGTWYAPEGTSFTFNEDGTTDFPGAATYKFRPFQRTLMLFNALGNPVRTLMLDEVEKNYLLAADYVTDTYTYYTNSASLVTSLTMSENTLTLESGSTVQLSVTATPSDAFNSSVIWTSSDESVATVYANGFVTAVAGGTCTITATAVDGSGKTATCEVTVIQLVTNITLSHTSLTLKLDGYQKLTATVLPDNATNKEVTWSSSDENVAEVTKTGGVAAIGEGECTITCTATDGSGVSATCSVVVDDVMHSADDYVDLDLPSKTLWATCNIGANSPEEYGDYFAWGETVPYGQEDTSNAHNYTTTGSYTKSTFIWSTYKWSSGSDANTLTKYNNSSGYGVVDNNLELDLADDAAYVNWGPAWRMPSKEDFDELTNISYTTTEWTTQNGVYGRKITSNSNGNSVFLPAAGGGSNSFSHAGSRGYYWSRTLDESNPSYAFFLSFNSSGISTSGFNRCVGRSVRPVRLSE